MSKGDPRDEYLDASANVRHFQTVRFAQLTIFIAINWDLLAVLFRNPVSSGLRAFFLFKGAGILVVFLFCVLQECTICYCRHYQDRAAELEEQFGFAQ